MSMGYVITLALVVIVFALAFRWMIQSLKAKPIKKMEFVASLVLVAFLGMILLANLVGGGG
jgi:hypothetical protein